MVRRLLLHSSALVLTLVSLGCGGRREQFLGSRVEEACGGEWPVCDRIVGCFLGDRSYIEGAFPGSRRIAVQVFEPSKVTVSFLLDEVTAAGEETTVTFFEDRCRSRERVETTGKAFLAESANAGFVKKSAQLTGVGDHLIEFESDARAKYTVKVDVRPIRLGDDENL